MVKKRIVTMMLAVIMCLAFSTQKVGAEESSCSHANKISLTEYTTLYNTTHRVYRNLYVDGVQVYSICNVSVEQIWYKNRCPDCKESLPKTYGGIVETHSLADDPDHK